MKTIYYTVSYLVSVAPGTAFRSPTYSVVGMFTGSDTDIEGLEGLSDGRVSDGIIGRSRLFDEPRLQGLKFLHVLHSLRDIPHL